MIFSMTGYGKGVAENKISVYEVEVKSINSRFLDLQLRIPSFLTHKEYEIRELVKGKIKRGKITVIVQYKNKEGVEGLAEIDSEKLKKYLRYIKELKKAAKITEKVRLEHLLENKDLFTSTEEGFSEEQFNLLKDALNIALKDLIKMKQNEGKELKKDLEKRVEIIEQKLNLIEGESAKTVSEYFEKFKEKVRILVSETETFNDRMELEVAILAEKAEITEESVRLRSHIKFFRDSLNTEEDPGRKLNFLCQEMNREANTISSKSISTFITHNTVLIKEEIEKIREQIQNIE